MTDDQDHIEKRFHLKDTEQDDFRSPNDPTRSRDSLYEMQQQAANAENVDFQDQLAAGETGTFTRIRNKLTGRNKKDLGNGVTREYHGAGYVDLGPTVFHPQNPENQSNPDVDDNSFTENNDGRGAPETDETNDTTETVNPTSDSGEDNEGEQPRNESDGGEPGPDGGGESGDPYSDEYYDEYNQSRFDPDSDENPQNNPEQPPQPSPEQVKRQNREDWAKAIGYDIGVGGVNLVGAVAQAADKGFGVLTNIAKGLLSGDALGIGETIGDSIVDGYMALKPIEQSIGQMAGINEKNGTIDPEAAGTMRGGQYYQDKRRVAEYHENMDKWLGEELRKTGIDPKGMKEGNILQYIDRMDTEQLTRLEAAMARRFSEEKQRLYNRANNGELDKIDDALIKSYENVGNAISTVAEKRRRDSALQSAQDRNRATGENLKAQAEKIEWDRSMNQLAEYIRNPKYENRRNQILFDIMEDKIRNSFRSGNRDQATGEWYLKQDPKTGEWFVNENRMDSNDWDRARSYLESLQGTRRAQGKDLTPEENDLLQKYRRLLDDRAYYRAEQRDKNNWERARVGEQDSVIDRDKANRLYHRQFDEGNVDPHGLSNVPATRNEMSREAGYILRDIQKDVYTAMNGKEPGMGEELTHEQWVDYLSNPEKYGIDLDNPDDPNLRNYLKGVMAANTRKAISLKNHLAKFDWAGDNRIPEIEDAYLKMKYAADDVLNTYVMKKGDVYTTPETRFRDGVQPGSPEEKFVKAYNEFIEAYHDMRARQIEEDLRGVAEPDKIDQKVIVEQSKYPYMKEGTSNDPTAIFGRWDSDGDPEEPGNGTVNTNGSDPDTVNPTSKSIHIDAEGLTYGELFPIVKSRLRLDDIGAHDFIVNNMFNIGRIESEEDLLREIKKTADEGGIDEEVKRNSYDYTDTEKLQEKQNKRKGYDKYRRWEIGEEKNRTQPSKPVKYTHEDDNPTEDIRTAEGIRAILGNARSQTGQGRRIRNHIKQYLTDQNLIEGDEMSEPNSEQQIYLDLANRLYRNRTGKNLYEPNAMRGTLAAMYRDMVDTKNTVANGYVGNTVWDDDDRDDVYEAAKILARKGFKLDPIEFFHTTDPEKLKSKYSRQYDNYSRLRDAYATKNEDEDLERGFDTLWRRYVADLMRGYKATDEDYALDKAIDATVMKIMGETAYYDDKNKDEVAKKRDEIEDLFRNRILNYEKGLFEPSDKNGIPYRTSSAGYIQNLLDNLENVYGEAHVARYGYDRKLERRREMLDTVLKKLSDSVGDAASISFDELSSMDPDARRKELIRIFNKMDKSSARDVANALKKYRDRINEMGDINYSQYKMYDTDYEPKFRESFGRLKGFNDTFDAILDAANTRASIGDDELRPKVGNDKYFNQKHLRGWMVPNWALDSEKAPGDGFTLNFVFPLLSGYVRDLNDSVVGKERDGVIVDMSKKLASYDDDTFLKLYSWLNETKRKIDAVDECLKMGYPRYSDMYKKMSPQEIEAKGLYSPLQIKSFYSASLTKKDENGRRVPQGVYAYKDLLKGLWELARMENQQRGDLVRRKGRVYTRQEAEDLDLL